MNKIRVKVKEIAKSGSVALVKLQSIDGNAEFSAIMLDFAGNLTQDSECSVIFKESEVMIASVDSRISARNRFISRIAKIKCDEIFARIFLDFLGQSITALITKEASDELNLKEGDSVMWFVKSNEVMVEFK